MGKKRIKRVKRMKLVFLTRSCGFFLMMDDIIKTIKVKTAFFFYIFLLFKSLCIRSRQKKTQFYKARSFCVQTAIGFLL